MDDHSLSNDALRQNLDELELINTLLGGYAPLSNALEQLVQRVGVSSFRILDAGSGGGDTLRYLARWAKRKGYSLELEGLDVNPFMLEYARQKALHYPQISFSKADVFSETIAQKQADVLTASLFCHHFSDEDLVTLFRNWYRQVRYAFIINDLHRHPLAYYSIYWLTRLGKGSYLVQHDAPLSVLRAFKRRELQVLLHKAGITNYQIRWCWAFRYQVIVWKN
jgi:SAM-dependent methyltransferase